MQRQASTVEQNNVTDFHYSASLTTVLPKSETLRWPTLQHLLWPWQPARIRLLDNPCQTSSCAWLCKVLRGHAEQHAFRCIDCLLHVQLRLWMGHKGRGFPLTVQTGIVRGQMAWATNSFLARCLGGGDSNMLENLALKPVHLGNLVRTVS